MSLVVSKTVANLYQSPDCVSELVSQLLLGEAVRQLDEWQGWSRIAGPDGYEGWVDSSDLRVMEEAGNERRRRIRERIAVLRHAPSSRHGPILFASIGTVLPVFEERDEWTALRLPDDRAGWIESRRLETDTPRASDPCFLLDTARAYLGVPYLWGGVSGFGIDCSGFTQAVYAMHGVFLPRDAHQQAACGAPVEPVSIETGDLVFFASEKDAPRERITHVGMAAGRNRLIHAWGSRGMVVETPLEPVGVAWGARRPFVASGSGGMTNE